MLFGTLTVIAVALTCTMFATRKAMLGFPSAMFWAILGAYCYLESATPWGDIYFYAFFASGFGMTIFSMIAAFGLREKRDTVADEEMDEEVTEKGGDKYIDEDGEDRGFDDGFEDRSQRPSRRTEELHERAVRRRTGESRTHRSSYGEFR